MSDSERELLKRANAVIDDFRSSFPFVPPESVASHLRHCALRLMALMHEFDKQPKEKA